MYTNRLLLLAALVCLISTAYSAHERFEAVVYVPMGEEAEYEVKGGQSHSCFVNYTNACPYTTQSEWLYYGDQSKCEKIPCQQVTAGGAYQCPYSRVYDSGGVNPDYQDCEDAGESASSGYEGDVSGQNYDCGDYCTCNTGLNGCTSGTWGAQLRCKTTGTEFDDRPTCSPDTTSPACPKVGMEYAPRLRLIAYANGFTPNGG